MKPPVPIKENQPFEAVCLGYNSCDILCLMDDFPRANTKTRLNRLIREGGGQAATAAVGLARLGLRARYIGKFGDTPEGEFARESLRKEGVDTMGSLVAPHTQNQVAVIWIDEGTGERTITYIREPGLEIYPEDLSRDLIASGGCLLADAHNIPATIQAAKWARKEGIPVVLDVERDLPDVETLLDFTDYILCDENFPKIYTGDSNGERALRAIRDRHNAPLVAMTMGAHGSLALVEDRFIHTPAFEVEVIDTTGAGDIWHSGFAAGLIWGWEIEEILRLAAATSALKCRKLGGREGIAGKSETLDFLASAEPKRFPV
ncbi:MAG TPA: PfkB family carbohydrate kinase [bacterium]|nr:PfkB family carbohydrate kinase [bacterium]